MMLLSLLTALACVTDEDCLSDCEGGDWDACVWYARMTARAEPWDAPMHRVAIGARRRPSEGPSFAGTVLACEAGAREDCELVRRWWHERPAGMFVGRRALQGCREGVAEACQELYGIEQYGWLPGHLDDLENELCQAAYWSGCPLDARPAFARLGLGPESCGRRRLEEPEQVEACLGHFSPRWTDPPPVARTMDIRCGSGHLESCLWLATEGWRVGADPFVNESWQLWECVREEQGCAGLREALPDWLCASDRSCAARCAEGDALSCGRAWIFDRERFLRARRLVIEGCEAGHHGSCVAALDADGWEEVARFCERGVYAACVALPSPTGLQKLAHLACAEGHPGACAVQAVRDGTEEAYVAERLQPVVERCAHGDIEACRGLAGVLERGYRAPDWRPHPGLREHWGRTERMRMDPSLLTGALVELLENADRCTMAAPDACHRRTAAALSLADACASSQSGCGAVAEATGAVCRALPLLGTAQTCVERLRSRRLEGPACFAGDPDSCLLLALVDGHEVWIDRACDAGHTWICGWTPPGARTVDPARKRRHRRPGGKKR